MKTTTAAPIGNTYNKYGSKNPIERYLMDNFFSSLNESLPSKPPEHILEVGAGEGEVAEFVKNQFPSANYVALDLLDLDLTDEWHHRQIHGLFGDIANLPFRTNKFDLVLAIEVLEHVADPTAALVEIKRVAASNVLTSVPREPIWRAANMARGKYLGEFGNTPGHVNHWTSAGFRRLIDAHLTVKAVRRPFPWTMVTATV